LTFILKYAEDDYVKSHFLKKQLYLEKYFYFSNFCSKGKYNIARILIRYF
jgi:hypothetical protein